MTLRSAVILTAVAMISVMGRANAATLEVPQNGGDASGIGYFSGWKCPPNDNISIVVDGGAPIPVPSGVRRSDTAGACGNDGRNGYISQINFNLLGAGTHTAVARQNGVAFAQSTFTVTTFGQNFLTGASGTYTLQNFPQPGKTTTIEWSQGAQNFIITGTSGGTVQCPVNAPITNLQVSCPDIGYGYVRSDVVAVLGTNGQTAGICAILETSPQDVACFFGPINSPTTFSLATGNVNGGPFEALLAGSAGNIASNGNVLNFTVGVPGTPLVPFLGLQFSQTVTNTSAAEASRADQAAWLLDALRIALWADGGGGAEPNGGSADSRSLAEILQSEAGNSDPARLP